MTENEHTMYNALVEATNLLSRIWSEQECLEGEFCSSIIDLRHRIWTHPTMRRMAREVESSNVVLQKSNES